MGGKVRISFRISLDFFRAQALPSTEDKCGDRGIFLVMTRTVSAKQGSRGRTLELPEPPLTGATSRRGKPHQDKLLQFADVPGLVASPFLCLRYGFLVRQAFKKAASLSEQAQGRHRGYLLPSLALTRILSKLSSLASIFSSTKRG